MEYITGLDWLDFSDIYDLDKLKPHVVKPNGAKLINFSQKYGDPEVINKEDM